MEYVDKLLLAIQIFVAVGIVILVHELGHFLMARYRGVRVDKFSLGFGPRLFGFKRGDTDYMICLFFFFGGFVKMAGEDPENREKFEKWEYFGQPWWSRSLIVFAGPFMNFVFAYIVFVLIMTIGVKYPDHTTRIGSVEKYSIAEKAGLKKNDEILSVNGQEVKSWSEFVDKFNKEKTPVLLVTDGKKPREIKLDYLKDKGPEYIIPVIGSVTAGSPAFAAGFKEGDEVLKIDGASINEFADIVKATAASKGKELVFELKRDKKTVKCTVKPMKDSVIANKYIIGIRAVPFPDISYYESPVIDSVSPGTPAYKAGLNEGDEVLKINGVAIDQFLEIGKATMTSEGKEMLFEIKRGKEIITRKVTPMKDNVVTNSYIIGISGKAPFYKYDRTNFFKALGYAGERIYYISKLQLVAISKLITGKMSAKDSLGGPVMIVQSAANMAERGMSEFITFFAFISVALGLFNLIIPIPVVDCGVLLLFILEGIRGKPVSFKVQNILAQGGFFLLIALAVIITWNDIAKIVLRNLIK